VKLLILRPQPGADATAALARTLGIEPCVMPLFRIDAIDWVMPDRTQYDALLMTSANAARSIKQPDDALRALPVYAVGQATALAATQAGFKIASTGAADAKAALANAEAAGHHRLLWLTGTDHIALNPPKNGTLDSVAVYQSCRVESDADIINAIKNCAVVALHSARAARHFGALVNHAALDRSAITVAALSLAVAQDAGLGWRFILVADIPEDAAMLRLVQSYFTKQQGRAN
jgi:uroporphyrinogen-III synthase